MKRARKQHRRARADIGVKVSTLLVCLCSPLLGCGAHSDDGDLLRRGAIAVGLVAAPDAHGEDGHVLTRTRRLAVGMNAHVTDVSADGRHFVFTDWNTGNVAIRDNASGDVRRISTEVVGYDQGYGYSGRLSPDQRTVAYWWTRLDLPDRIVHEIRVGAAQGKDDGIRTLFARSSEDNPDPSLLAWAPDGQSLLTVYRTKAGETQLILIPVDGTGYRVLASLGWSTPVGLAFSPDGRFAAYDIVASPDADRRVIRAHPVTGGRSRTLVRHDSDNYLLGWGPDDHLYFSSDRSGTPGVWRTRVTRRGSAARPELVRPDLWRIQGVGLDRYGRFYYTSDVGSRDVHIATIDPASGDIRMPTTGFVSPAVVGSHNPAWSRDGRKLAYIAQRASARNGPLMGPVIVVRSLATGDTREFPLPAGVLGPQHLNWSADGLALLLSARRGLEGTTLLEVNVQTGHVSRTPLDADRQFVVLPDGEHILLRRSISLIEGESPAGQLIRRHLRTGDETVIAQIPPTGAPAPGPIHTIAASPDGAHVAAVLWTPEGMPIMVFPAEGGEGRVLSVHDRPAWGSSLTFTADSRGLYFADRFNTGDQADEWVVRPWLIDIESGERRELNHLPRMTTVFRPHPDGRRLATVSGTIEPELWVMEEIAPVQRPGHEP